jgi:orotidine-5'-phosphate decarboxylase
VKFVEKLQNIARKNRSLVCVGLDPDPKMMPNKIGLFEFNKSIIEATSDLACAFKLNLAFYEAMGPEGLEALKRSVEVIPKGLISIGDAKRGDIGNTSRAYARALFDYFQFDSATVSPYLGFDSVEPFTQYQDKGIFILCRTSNAGATDFQSLLCQADHGPAPLFEVVARKADKWNVNGNIGLVVGATYPEELKLIRQGHPDLPLLIPGVGAQGGELKLASTYGVDRNGGNAIINSSRGIIYASRGRDFAEAARKAARELRDEINRHLAGMQSAGQDL